ncbi:MAG: hypothetical protein EBU90_19935 [Proteobacteria bacterium]|nr:hypothetical protein [Pseudomonadota bacterium]NBP15755.1 hypothetical protein [bacterium]
MQVKYEPWGFKKEGIDVWGIQIVEGKFKDTTISINDLEIMDDGSGEVKLDYEYVLKPKHLTDEDYTSDEFNRVISFVLEDLLKKAITNDVENRDSNTTKSDQ